jgi:hypothetical protein
VRPATGCPARREVETASYLVDTVGQKHPRRSPTIIALFKARHLPNIRRQIPRNCHIIDSIGRPFSGISPSY